VRASVNSSPHATTATAFSTSAATRRGRSRSPLSPCPSCQGARGRRQGAGCGAHHAPCTMQHAPKSLAPSLPSASHSKVRLRVEGARTDLPARPGAERVKRTVVRHHGRVSRSARCVRDRRAGRECDLGRHQHVLPGVRGRPALPGAVPTAREQSACACAASRVIRGARPRCGPSPSGGPRGECRRR